MFNNFTGKCIATVSPSEHPSEKDWRNPHRLVIFPYILRFYPMQIWNSKCIIRDVFRQKIKCIHKWIKLDKILQHSVAVSLLLEFDVVKIDCSGVDGAVAALADNSSTLTFIRWFSVIVSTTFRYHCNGITFTQDNVLPYF